LLSAGLSFAADGKVFTRDAGAFPESVPGIRHLTGRLTRDVSLFRTSNGDGGQKNARPRSAKSETEIETHHDDEIQPTYRRPSFLLDPEGGRNTTITVLISRNAILPCYVAYLGYKTVSLLEFIYSTLYSYISSASSSLTVVFLRLGSK
jgi:hypothetical protein